MSISADVLTSYKKIDEAAADALLAKEIAANNKKIVVLDDDPTGVQTVHDIHVYTNWDHDSIKAGFEEENNLFYVMTNSRGFTAEQTTKAHHEIAAVVDQVAKRPAEIHLHQPQRLHSARTLSAGDRAPEGRLRKVYRQAD